MLRVVRTKFFGLRLAEGSTNPIERIELTEQQARKTPRVALSKELLDEPNTRSAATLAFSRFQIACFHTARCAVSLNRHE